ncbi:MAG: hypothetical protein AB7L09_01815 [Nitrospira sp.]
MTRLSVISMTRLLREQGWPFRAALDLSKAVRTLADNGTLPPGEAMILPDNGQGTPVTVEALERAGGVVRVATVPVVVASRLTANATASATV